MDVLQHINVNVTTEAKSVPKHPPRAKSASLTALRDRDSVCRMSSMVFSTRPLHSRWGNLRTDVRAHGETVRFNALQSGRSRVSKRISRFSQAGQIFVGHSADPLVDVVEVDQQELSVAFKLLLVGFGLLLPM